MLRVGCPAAQGVEAARAPTPRALCDCFRQSRRALVTKGGCGEGEGAMNGPQLEVIATC